jgi:chitin disaccharide deacetylase
VKALIVNGDDFGFSLEVNAGVLRAHRDGILTSASLMVAESARDEAARAARDNPALDVGLHTVVCRGRSMLAPDRLRGAVTADGRFLENPVLAGLRYYFDRSMRAKLAAELRAQVEEHLKRVGCLNHIDGHLNFHVHPVLGDILVELAIEYRVPCLRVPREPAMTTLALARDHLPRKLAEAVIFRALSRRMHRLMRERGLRSNDWLFGLHQSGHLTEDYVLGVLARLRDGVTELYFHPAADAGGTPPPAWAQREVAILTSPRIREAIESKAIRLMTYRDLAAAPTGA